MLRNRVKMRSKASRSGEFEFSDILLPIGKWFRDQGWRLILLKVLIGGIVK